jgi:hypothetical protein
LTGDFLDLEREIDSFAMQWRVEMFDQVTPRQRSKRREGMHAGLHEELASIEAKAATLREKAAERFSGSMPPDPPRRSDGPVKGMP